MILYGSNKFNVRLWAVLQETTKRNVIRWCHWSTSWSQISWPYEIPLWTFPKGLWSDRPVRREQKKELMMLQSRSKEEDSDLWSVECDPTSRTHQNLNNGTFWSRDVCDAVEAACVMCDLWCRQRSRNEKKKKSTRVSLMQSLETDMYTCGWELIPLSLLTHNTLWSLLTWVHQWFSKHR